MDDLRQRAIANLIRRRNALSAQYDAILAEPASYGITGAVNVTNHNLKELRNEIKNCDDKIAALCGGTGGISGIQIKIPDYRCPYENFTEELNGNV